MGIFEKAATPRPQETPSRRAMRVAQSSSAHLRAMRRLQIAKLSYHTEGSLSDKRDAVIASIKAGLIPAGSYPGVPTVRDLQAKYAGGARSVLDYMELPRSGRPRKPLLEPFESHVRQAISEGSGKGERELHRECVTIAKARGYQAPTRHQVRERVRSGYRTRHAAARHGSRAGEIDGLPHGRLATEYAHDVWCLDELTMPVWVRVPDVELRRWVSALCDVVLIVDVRSSAVVGWHLVDPEGRTGENGAGMLGGAREADVLSAIMSAACPELAADSTREFAGWLPSLLRWDNHQAHKSLAGKIAEVGIDLDTRFIRKRRAISNGPVENRVGTLKRWTKGLRGHVDRYVPTDRVTNDSAADQARVRTAIAGRTSDRRTERQPILPADLMDVRELRDAFNRIVQRYNFEHVNRVFNESAAHRFFRQLHPKRGRNGRGVIALIQAQQTTVQKNGIIHYQDDCEFRFEAVVDHSIMMLDSTVIYRAHPLMLGIFIERHGQQFFSRISPGKKELAAEIARNQIAIARMLSDEGKTAREARLTADIGEESHAAAQEEYARQIESYRAGVSDLEVLDLQDVRFSTETEQQPSLTGAEHFDPYADENLDRFVRPTTTDSNGRSIDD